jgi:hypothetical protein
MRLPRTQEQDDGPPLYPRGNWQSNRGVGRGGATYRSVESVRMAVPSARTRVVQPTLPGTSGCTWLWVATEAGLFIFMSQVRHKNERP